MTFDDFLEGWAAAATTTAGLFWTAFWAFCLGYLISGMIQVFVTRERMRRTMGEAGPKSVGLGTFFGFLSSSCSFAALSTTRALFAKGAGLIPALAFLLASTNLVVELGVVIAVFLAWQFVVGEYLGGLLLIGFMWILVKLTLPQSLEDEARERAQTDAAEDEPEDLPDWRERLMSKDGWRKVARAYVGEWRMVWKDVAIGFTVAGAIAAFVPRAFFETLFVGSGQQDPHLGQVVLQTLVGPVAAFFTFIGSMGNVPLAAVLYGNGVSFAGIMAFLFSDLVVFPVLRIQAKYYGWKMALYILGVFLAVLVAASLALHYGFELTGLLPSGEGVKQVSERSYFAVDATLFLNGAGLLLSGGFFAWALATRDDPGEGGGPTLGERVLFWLSLLAFAWLAGGLGVAAYRGGALHG
ncbi:MAG: permease [Planctomycetota bacterium]